MHIGEDSVQNLGVYIGEDSVRFPSSFDGPARPFLMHSIDSIL